MKNLKDMLNFGMSQIKRLKSYMSDILNMMLNSQFVTI